MVHPVRKPFLSVNLNAAQRSEESEISAITSLLVVKDARFLTAFGMTGERGSV